MKSDNYTFATGKIRALEAKLLDLTDIERMIDAENADIAFKVFNDTDYADNLLDVDTLHFRQALDDDLKQTKDLLTHLVPDFDLLRFIFLKYDFHNIKLAFKAKYSQADLKEEASPFSEFPYSVYEQYIVMGQNVDLHYDLKRIIDQLIVELEKEHDSHIIDSKLDCHYFVLYQKIARRLQNQFISQLAELQIDVANIKIFLRTKRMNKEMKWLAKELIDGGAIIKSDFVAVYDKDLKEAFKLCSRCFPKQLEQAFSAYQKNQKLWELEKALENYELEYTRQAKLIAYGPEVVVSYYYAKKNAIRNIRLIMTGKLNKVKPEEIRQRIRELY